MAFMPIVSFKNYFSIKRCYVGVLGCVEKCMGFGRIFF